MAILVPKDHGTFEAQVLRVVDGDTLDLLIDVGFNIHLKERVRLYGIDTPETRTRNKTEKKKGLMVKEFVGELLIFSHDKIIIKTLKEGKYGRYLVMVYYRDIYEKLVCLNDLLLKRGYAKEYYGGKR